MSLALNGINNNGQQKRKLFTPWAEIMRGLLIETSHFPGLKGVPSVQEKKEAWFDLVAILGHRWRMPGCRIWRMCGSSHPCIFSERWMLWELRTKAWGATQLLGGRTG